MRYLAASGLLFIRTLIGALFMAAPAMAANDHDESYTCPSPNDVTHPVIPTVKPVPDALIATLLSWIGDNTDYGAALNKHKPPTISFCEPGTWIDYEGDDILVERNLRAMYDFPNGEILIVQPWNATSARDVSTLLHELIHHAQMHGREWECPQALEWEAYELQESWLAERGIDSGFDWLQIYFLSRCPKGIHP